MKFTILAPPVNDSRPTMRISAVALREDDAKQGIAETKDHHTMERYFALGAASLLSGYGRAYQQTAGTTIISPSGVVAQTTTEPSTKQVIGSSVGEMGTAIASEVRRGSTVLLPTQHLRTKALACSSCKTFTINLDKEFDMKNWSFGKLIGVFAGSFVALIVVAVVVIKASSSPVAKAKRTAQIQLSRHNSHAWMC